MIRNHYLDHTYHLNHHSKDVLGLGFELGTHEHAVRETIQSDLSLSCLPFIADSTRLNSTNIRTASSSGASGIY